MKIILTIVVVLGVAISSVYGELQISNPSEEATQEHNEKNVRLCTQNLTAIGKAIQAYKEEHGDYPKWLSDLLPKNISDVSILLCPSDKKGGKPHYQDYIDPIAPVSYEYHFTEKYIPISQHYRSIYGDDIPIVRCRHHDSSDFECLNLSFSYKITQSRGLWQFYPEGIYGGIDAAITTLNNTIQKTPNSVRNSSLYSILMRLYIEDKRNDDAEQLFRQYKAIMNPDLLHHQLALGDMLERMNRNEDLLQLFIGLEKSHPTSKNVLNKLADIYEEQGLTELALEYRIKSNPAYALIGKTVEDFTATDLEGKPISLKQYRGKVVLLDFWAVWCGPCIAEMPNLKKVYDLYKNKGFDIIGVSLDDDESKLREYLKENQITWRQVYSGKGCVKFSAL